ncbi:YpfB family protein [Peribacillus sp. SCS-155]|uniref:YpfB family protein n=1 Tax=Peribacillus sedimenti TaxID=3115297 RepID=UPI003906A0B0
MDSFERIIIKLVVIQIICLVIFQIIFHNQTMFEFKKLTQYEGVNDDNYTKIIETFNGHSMKR